MTRRVKMCQNCRHGITAVDGDGVVYYVCTLLPPIALMVHEDAKAERLQWTRPPMTATGWCGQFSLHWLRWLFGYGKRA